MSELRKDPIVDRWVVMAPDRAARPIDIVEYLPSVESSFDPFAEGNESSTPAEILACRAAESVANRPGWRVRVVPNKFPALQGAAVSDRRRDGIYEAMTPFGAHEVIIECPHFETNISRLSVEHIGEILKVYRDRLNDLKRDRRLVHALIFKNQGALAGASLPHAHSQLIATPFVPVAIQDELYGSLRYFSDKGCAIFGEMIRQELATGSRIVVDAPHFVAFCPYASRFPFETWVLPKQPASHYENIGLDAIIELGTILKTVLLKLERALDDPPFNYMIHSAPFDQPELPWYNWHLEILPRTTRVAGFEWGSGSYINTVFPEVAARILREVR